MPDPSKGNAMSTFDTHDADVRTTDGSFTSQQRMKGTTASGWNTGKAVLAVLATALGAIGLLTISQPAPAYAACDQYAFPTEYRAAQSNFLGPTVGFNAPPNSQDVKGGNAWIVGGGGGTLEYANVSKGSDGVSRIAFQIRWSANSVGFYNGTVSDDGNVLGGWIIDADQPANQSNWFSLTPLVCYTPPAPAPAPVKDCGGGKTVPADQPCPPPPAQVKPGPTVTVVPVGRQVQVTVTERAGEAADCTYTATPRPGNPFALPDSHRFHLDPNETETFNRPDFPVIPPNATWDVVVDCGGAKVGRPDQPVQF
jgi:hypothetical protein